MAMKREKIQLTVTPIWGRQPQETPLAFLWFNKYIGEKLASGSIASLCKKENKNPGYKNHLETWAMKYRWTERLLAYQDYLRKQEVEAQVKAVREMGERQAWAGLLMQNKAMEFIVQMKFDKGDEDRALKYYEAGVKAERTARGTPTEIHADAELPEETRKRMESIYAESMSDAGKPEPAEFLEQEDIIETDETERG